MSSKITKNSAGLSTWLDSLAETCNKAFKPAKEVNAEMNVKNLPTVSWKDETFYVDIVTGGAVLYNAFGNVVQEMPGVKSVDEVDHELNDHVVVAADEAQGPNDYATEEQVISADNPDEQIDEQADTPVEATFESELARVMAADAVHVDAEKRAKVGTPAAELKDTSAMLKAMSDAGVSFEQLGCSLANVSKVLADVDELKRMVTALSQQQYAYTTETPAPGSLDLGSQDAEVAHFNETAADTQKLIDAEHAVDISTQAGRAQLNYDFLDRIFGNTLSDSARQQIIDGVEQQLAPAEDEVDPASEEAVEEVAEDEQVVASADEQVKTASEIVPDATSPLARAVEQQLENGTESAASADALEAGHASVADVQDVLPTSNPFNDIVDEGPVMETQSEDVLSDESELDDEKAKLFEARTCPECNTAEALELEHAIADDDVTAAVRCASCGKHYVVETETGKVRLVQNEEE